MRARCAPEVALSRELMSQRMKGRLEYRRIDRSFKMFPTTFEIQQISGVLSYDSLRQGACQASVSPMRNNHLQSPNAFHWLPFVPSKSHCRIPRRLHKSNLVHDSSLLITFRIRSVSLTTKLIFRRCIGYAAFVTIPLLSYTSRPTAHYSPDRTIVTIMPQKFPLSPSCQCHNVAIFFLKCMPVSCILR